ncbi:stearoyl-CoA desaturase (delta-9 desaturase) [Saccharomonospora amisosensis]|uniref:Stearoyl-CoA desaturase (Delta-9 desaturase) n=1 Tax=Saccharomonospora amisosensis TaxID=1128677 RepID=A0A7X5UPM4_9PSEU|nr:fatty acid desaturase [Saccharomonospora amisosensis]NIJ11882.1 stearoyl-CoA desaturase (delta-9 desaturase) [Saccharomonospora amisosensis]
MTEDMAERAPERPVPRRKTINSPYLHRLQRRHFLLFDILPIVGTAAAFVFLAVHPFGWTELALLLSMWLLTGLGVTVGYHRLFTHRTFKAAQPVAVVLAVLGSMAGQGGLVSWVALHRRHHEYSDREGDPHSPNLSGGGLRGTLRGLAHSHFLWMRRHEYPNIVHYAPDLIRDRALVRVARLYYHWVVLGLVVPAAVGGLVSMSWTGAVSGLLWGGLVRIFVLEHIVWAINSFLHMFGTRPYQSRENSRNGGIFAIVTLGESWHNNHHAFPESPSFGLDWYRLDPGFWLIKLLACCGLAWDLKVPSAARMDAKRITAA